MTVLALSRGQAKDADRVGGIELMLLWPPALSPEPTGLALDHEREAKPAEKAAAEAIVRPACERYGLVPVHVRVARVRRPVSAGIPAPGEDRVHLAVTIIGRRWVHASTRRAPKLAFSALST